MEQGSSAIASGVAPRRARAGQGPDPTASPFAAPMTWYTAIATSAALYGMCFYSMFTARFDPGMNRDVTVKLIVVTAVVAAVVLLLPWKRWPDDAVMIMAMVAAPALALFNHATGYTSTPIGLVVISAQLFCMAGIGALTIRRGWNIVYGLYAGGVFSTAALIAGSPMTTLVAPAIAGPFAMMMAETVAWTVTSLSAARALEHQRVEDIRTLASRTAQLRGDVPVERATDAIVETARELLRGTDARLLTLVQADDAAWPAEFAEARAEAHDTATIVAVDVGEDDGGIVLPLPGERGVWGVIAVRLDRPADAFTVSLAELVALEAGTALDRLRTIAALTEEVSIDQLTGVGNRRFADAALASLAPGDAVMLFDLDGLKPVNDTLGHAAGDDLLRGLAEFLVAQQRDGDAVARLGGDEFVWVARGLGRITGRVAEQARRRWMNSAPLSTVSVGVAVHEVGDTTGRTLANADAALYRSKHAGGDRVSEHEPLDGVTA